CWNGESNLDGESGRENLDKEDLRRENLDGGHLTGENLDGRIWTGRIWTGGILDGENLGGGGSSGQENLDGKNLAGKSRTDGKNLDALRREFGRREFWDRRIWTGRESGREICDGRIWTGRIWTGEGESGRERSGRVENLGGRESWRESLNLTAENLEGESGDGENLDGEKESGRARYLDAESLGGTNLDARIWTGLEFELEICNCGGQISETGQCRMDLKTQFTIAQTVGQGLGIVLNLIFYFGQDAGAESGDSSDAMWYFYCYVPFQPDPVLELRCLCLCAPFWYREHKNRHSAHLSSGYHRVAFFVEFPYCIIINKRLQCYEVNSTAGNASANAIVKRCVFGDAPVSMKSAFGIAYFRRFVFGSCGDSGGPAAATTSQTESVSPAAVPRTGTAGRDEAACKLRDQGAADVGNYVDKIGLMLIGASDPFGKPTPTPTPPPPPPPLLPLLVALLFRLRFWMPSFFIVSGRWIWRGRKALLHTDSPSLFRRPASVVLSCPDSLLTLPDSRLYWPIPPAPAAAAPPPPHALAPAALRAAVLPALGAPRPPPRLPACRSSGQYRRVSTEVSALAHAVNRTQPDFES
uniref:CUB domain-containing protein n=1 Tax=Macrostomum lignano TaxID=282301 RepID=A0A1I8FEM5_9PLAT